MSTRNLLVVATSAELSGVGSHIKPYLVTRINDNWDVLITGVGMVSTVFHLSNVLTQNKYDQIVNVGLAGAINRNLSLGQIVNVVTDEFAFFGAEDNGQFISVFDLKLQEVNEPPYLNKVLTTEQTNFNIGSIQKVIGVTVQTVTGTSSTIDLLLKTYNADVETMEGAAVFYVANQFNIPATQLRAISNYVEPRNRENWKINVALEALNQTILSLLEEC